MSRVLVTGGSGTLGRLVVDRLADAGHDTTVLSRHEAPAPSSPHGTRVRTVVGDLRDGSGLAEAVAGVDAIVHCASDPRDARAVDVAGTENLARASVQAAGSPHLVYVSIVGVDRIPWGYYNAKHDAERVVRDSGLPWTVQRATQFHGFVALMLGQLARSPVMPLPRGFRFQPVSAAEVADRIVRHVESGPGQHADDVGGPEVLSLRDLARTWLSATRRRRLTVPVPVPGRVAAAFREGANLCPGHADGTATWAQFLEGLAPAAAPPAR